MSATRVIFVHRPAHTTTGAKRMRVDQLCALIGPHLEGEFSFETMRTPPKDAPRRRRQSARLVEGAIVVFHKRAWLALDYETLALWREAARALTVDWVDARVIEPACEIDLHLAASEAGRNHLADRFGAPRTALLDHHADPVLSDLPKRGTDTVLHVAYLGNPANTALPDEVRDRIHLPAYDGGPLSPGALSDLAEANMHWAVRGAEPAANRSWFKPFTKGANAAALGANVIIEQSADDAVRFLGEDYPFLVPDARPENLIDALDRAAATVGTPVWDDALAVMAEMRARLSPERIASQFREAVARYRA